MRLCHVRADLDDDTTGGGGGGIGTVLRRCLFAAACAAACAAAATGHASRPAHPATLTAEHVPMRRLSQRREPIAD